MMVTSRAITVLILTILMCCISGIIAVGKLRAADPADIFENLLVIQLSVIRFLVKI